MIGAAKLQVRQKIRADRPPLGRHDEGRLHYRKEGGVATRGPCKESYRAGNGERTDESICAEAFLAVQWLTKETAANSIV